MSSPAGKHAAAKASIDETSHSSMVSFSIARPGEHHIRSDDDTTIRLQAAMVGAARCAPEDEFENPAKFLVRQIGIVINGSHVGHKRTDHIHETALGREPAHGIGVHRHDSLVDEAEDHGFASGSPLGNDIEQRKSRPHLADMLVVKRAANPRHDHDDVCEIDTRESLHEAVEVASDEKASEIALHGRHHGHEVHGHPLTLK